MKTIAVIGALEKEVREVFAAVEGATTKEEAGLTVLAGTYNGARLVATTAGMGTVNAAAAAQHLISAYHMGTVNAAAAAQHLISAYHADAIIFSGIAGGLNPVLHVGDIVIGERLRYLDTDTALIAESAPGLEEYASTPQLVEIAESLLAGRGYRNAAEGATGTDTLQYLRGTIATGDRFVSGAEMREAAIAATQADCVEMEGAAIAHVAAKNGIDCLVMRAISDNCDEAYDALCTREFDLEEYAQRASHLTLGIVRRFIEAQA